MDDRITDRQREFLNFLSAYERKYGRGPTFREIALGMDVTSKGTISTVVDALVEKGFVRRKDGEVRGLSVVSRRKVAA